MYQRSRLQRKERSAELDYLTSMFFDYTTNVCTPPAQLLLLRSAMRPTKSKRMYKFVCLQTSLYEG